MTLLRIASAALLLLGLTAPLAAAPGQHGIERVVIVVLENTDAAKAIEQPFLSRLAGMGALLANYSAVARPSQPNYIALTSGDTWGVVNNSRHTLDVRHIGDLVEEAGLTWRAYAEGYPGNCDLRSSDGPYARKHVPFLSYANVQSDPVRCAQVVNASQFEADIVGGTLPAFAFYTPDNRNNGHDTGVDFADAWLAGWLGPLLADPRLMDGTLLIVTFDEGGREDLVYTVLYGEMIESGAVSRTAYDHYSLLRTIEDVLGLGTLGRRDATAVPITDVFR